MTVHPGQGSIHPVPALPPEPIYRLTVEQYHWMIADGILTEDDPVELIEGWLIPKMPKNPPHSVTTDLTAEKLNEVKPPGWRVRVQDPITTTDSEPEPDVTLVRGNPRDYLTNHPKPADMALVVEVADSTLERDRTLKRRAYARAGISVYWIINLVDRTVEVFTDPTGPHAKPTFRNEVVRTEDESVPLVIEGREVCLIPVRDLLP